jgi:hypothetical protein
MSHKKNNNYRCDISGKSVAIELLSRLWLATKTGGANREIHGRVIFSSAVVKDTKRNEVLNNSFYCHASYVLSRCHKCGYILVFGR